MNLEFHYYTTAYLALKAGFDPDEAHVLAHSSQAVDTSVMQLQIQTNRGLIRIEPTQNYGYWEKNTPERVYLPFHFFPGLMQTSVRKDHAVSPLSVTPNSAGVKHLLVSALKTRSLYRIGIALHTFADSWAHQNFTGIKEDWNQLENSPIIPSVGHAQAGKLPDLYGETWEDPRLLLPLVVNKDRFLQAAKKIFRYLCLYRGRGYEDEDYVMAELEETFAAGLAAKGAADRMVEFCWRHEIEEYNRLLWQDNAILTKDSGKKETPAFEGYDKVLWLRDQLLQRSRFITPEVHQAQKGFFESHFFNWNEAANAHRLEAQTWLDQNLPGWRQTVQHNGTT